MFSHKKVDATFMMNARLARFYGFSHKEIQSMSYGLIMRYFQAITHLEAEEMLNQMTISSAPHMKTKDRRDLNNKLDRLRFRSKENVMTMDQFAGKLSNGK